MKRWIAISIIALIFFIGLPVSAQQDPSQEKGEWFCPGGRGFGRMSGTPQCQFSQGRCPRGQGPRGIRANSGEPINKDQAARLLDNYISRTGNANLKAGEIVEKGQYFEASVMKTDGSPAERMEIDKNSGLFRRIQ
jgi:hypothetical protein